jgi:hypothetical protein
MTFLSGLMSAVPVPPYDATVSGTVETTVTTVMASLATAALVFALVYWWRTGRPTILALFVAGGAMMLLEPFVDVVGGCWHPNDLARVFTLWDRPMPVWLCLTYFVYFGVGGGLTWMVLRRGMTPKLLWGLFISSAVGDAVMEMVLLHWNTYVYYGDQPLVLMKFPLWWAPVNSLVDVAVAVAIVRFEPALRGVRAVLIVPLAVGISAAVNTVAGWPSWTAINSDIGGIGGALLGVATFAVAAAIMWLLANLKATTPAPARTEAPALVG